MKIEPLRGWLLDRAAEIDSDVPGFFGHLMRSSAERRQVIAAYLSRDRTRDWRTNNWDIGPYLMTARHDEVLNAAFGSNPPGFRTALRRAGSQPHNRRFYAYLHGLLASSTRPEFARLLQSFQQITPERLRILRALPDDVRCAPIVSAIENIRDARDLAQLVEVLTENGADRPAMVESLRRIDSRSALSRFAKRWSLRVRLPAHPVTASKTYLPVDTAADLRALARRYRNCATNYVSNALEGRSSFAEIVHPQGRAVVHILQLRGEWRLDRCYGRSNGPVPQAVRDAARDYLREFGIEQRQRRSERTGKWEPLRRLAGYFDYEDDE